MTLLDDLRAAIAKIAAILRPHLRRLWADARHATHDAANRLRPIAQRTRADAQAAATEAARTAASTLRSSLTDSRTTLTSAARTVSARAAIVASAARALSTRATTLRATLTSASRDLSARTAALRTTARRLHSRLTARKSGHVCPAQPNEPKASALARLAAVTAILTTACLGAVRAKWSGGVLGVVRAKGQGLWAGFVQAAGSLRSRVSGRWAAFASDLQTAATRRPDTSSHQDLPAEPARLPTVMEAPVSLEESAPVWGRDRESGVAGEREAVGLASLLDGRGVADAELAEAELAQRAKVLAAYLAKGAVLAGKGAAAAGRGAVVVGKGAAVAGRGAREVARVAKPAGVAGWRLAKTGLSRGLVLAGQGIVKVKGMRVPRIFGGLKVVAAIAGGVLVIVATGYGIGQLGRDHLPAAAPVPAAPSAEAVLAPALVPAAAAPVPQLAPRMVPLSKFNPITGPGQPPLPADDYGPSGSRRNTGTDEVALTFDDGPDPRWTPEVLSQLKEYRIKATFCLIGVNVVEFPELVRDIANDGHTLCNHSWGHDTSLGNRSYATILSDMQRTNEAIRAAAPDSRISYFRHPGGAWTPNAVAAANQLGMSSLHWDVDPRDWLKPGARAISATVVNSSVPGSIILLHDGGGDRRGTSDALRSILPNLAARFRLVALPPGVDPPKLYGIDLPIHAGQE
jgi:peptidoglycan/xylan/chitin deacetylase (PgdA/CDA1 family)